MTKYGKGGKIEYAQFVKLMIDIVGDAENRDELINGMRLICKEQGFSSKALLGKMFEVCSLISSCTTTQRPAQQQQRNAGFGCVSVPAPAPGAWRQDAEVAYILEHSKALDKDKGTYDIPSFFHYVFEEA